MWLINFRFTFGLPEHINDDYLPLYGGKVWIRGSNGDDLSIPYGGTFSPKIDLTYSYQHVDASLRLIGAAYDTEKAFDSMFLGEPFITDRGANWT